MFVEVPTKSENPIRTHFFLYVRNPHFFYLLHILQHFLCNNSVACNTMPQNKTTLQRSKAQLSHFRKAEDNLNKTLVHILISFFGAPHFPSYLSVCPFCLCTASPFFLSA